MICGWETRAIPNSDKINLDGDQKNAVHYRSPTTLFLSLLQSCGFLTKCVCQRNRSTGASCSPIHQTPCFGPSEARSPARTTRHTQRPNDGRTRLGRGFLKRQLRTRWGTRAISANGAPTAGGL